MFAFIDAFIKNFKHNKKESPHKTIKRNPLANPQFLNKALGKAKEPAPKAQAIKENILALIDPLFTGPKYLVQQFLPLFEFLERFI